MGRNQGVKDSKDNSMTCNQSPSTCPENISEERINQVHLSYSQDVLRRHVGRHDRYQSYALLGCPRRIFRAHLSVLPFGVSL